MWQDHSNSEDKKMKIIPIELCKIFKQFRFALISGYFFCFIIFRPLLSLFNFNRLSPDSGAGHLLHYLFNANRRPQLRQP